MLRTKLSQIFMAGIALLAVSCAHLIPPVSTTFIPDGKTTVLYARMNLEDRISMGNRVALWLENTDLKEPVYIYFDKSQPLYAITAAPGHYRLMGLAGIDMTHRILDRSLFREKDSKERYFIPFEARTNTAVYIGDFTGCAKVNLVAEEWKIKSATNNFAHTTADFRQAYPNLASLETVSIFGVRP